MRADTTRSKVRGGATPPPHGGPPGARDERRSRSSGGTRKNGRRGSRRAAPTGGDARAAGCQGGPRAIPGEGPGEDGPTRGTGLRRRRKEATPEGARREGRGVSLPRRPAGTTRPSPARRVGNSAETRDGSRHREGKRTPGVPHRRPPDGRTGANKAAPRRTPDAALYLRANTAPFDRCQVPCQRRPRHTRSRNAREGTRRGGGHTQERPAASTSRRPLAKVCSEGYTVYCILHEAHSQDNSVWC